MATAEAESLSDLPSQVSRILGEFVDRSKNVFADDLRSIVLYGSAAEGRLRPTSDVNLLLIIARFDYPAAETLRKPLRVAQAAIRLSPMFVLEAELPDAITSFAEKFTDILRRRRILLGADPFTGVSIPREIVIARLDQVLLNLILRLREAYILRGLREEQLALTVAEAAGPIRSCAATLLELRGNRVKSGSEALATFVSRAAESHWQEVPPRLSEAREQRLLPPGIAAQTLQQLIEIATALRQDLNALPARS
jgi:predicted nucleotidyltransferase